MKKRPRSSNQYQRRQWPSMARKPSGVAFQRSAKNVLKPKSTETKMIIVMEEGILQAVYSNSPVKYALINYDKDIPVEESYLRGIFPSEVIHDDLAGLYNGQLHDIPEDFADIYQELQALNF